MMKLIPLLSNNADMTFDLIVPSLPGYGFSQKVTTPGCGVQFIAELVKVLMEPLGYKNFGIHWVTQTVHSLFRLYHESRKAPLHFEKGDFVRAPVGIVRFPFDDPFPPRKYIERGYNVQHWTEMPAGGHFASMEQPELLAKDIVKFFRGPGDTTASS